MQPSTIIAKENDFNAPDFDSKPADKAVFTLHESFFDGLRQIKKILAENRSIEKITTALDGWDVIYQKGGEDLGDDINEAGCSDCHWIEDGFEITRTFDENLQIKLTFLSKYSSDSDRLSINLDLA